MRVAIIHFRPIELYPPIHNLLNFLSAEEKEIEIFLYSTKRKIKGLQENSYEIKKSYRHIILSDNLPKWKRLFNYIQFNLYTTFSLLLTRPDKIIYFQTISSFPVFLIKKIFRSKAPIFIHYHEYFSPSHYNKVMKLEQFFHKRESYLYKTAYWISHTNQDRLRLFMKDNQLESNSDKLHDLPNFPPKAWKNHTSIKSKMNSSSPLKLVYVGALSTHNMYTKELFSWISKQKGEVLLDVFSINIKEDVFDYLHKLQCKFINFKGGVSYDKLPEVLRDYHVGLIIYNGKSLNYTYNAPNKLFEYFACDLDVWFSSDLISSYPYERDNSYPKILKVNFRDLDNFNWRSAIDRQHLNYKPSTYFCEEVLPHLTNKLKE